MYLANFLALIVACVCRLFRRGALVQFLSCVQIRDLRTGRQQRWSE